MRAYLKLMVGLVLATLIYPLGIFLLFSFVLGGAGLYEWYLNSWDRGSHVLGIFLKTIFSWGAIKFYLLAWGVGILMVCSVTYQNFKTEIRGCFKKFK